jgi:glycosyltransferase involved in cell wall biosynthesis
VLEVISEGVGGGAKHVYDLVTRLRDEFTFIVACPDNGPYFSLFKDLGAEVVELSLAVGTPQDFLTLRRVIRRCGVDLVHAHGRKAGFHGRLAGLMAGKPLVYSFHGLHHQKHGQLLRTLYCAAERTLTRHTDWVINVSASERQECLSLGFLNSRRSTVIPNGIDWRAFDAVAVEVPQVKADLGFAPDDLIVGHVGKFDMQKGQDDLALAIPQVIRQCAMAKFLLVGEGSLRPQIERLIASLGVEKQVVFAGFRQDVAALLKAMDIFVLPSRWEGLSLALLEAMACRKPVVATRVTGNIDVVIDGGTGFLVPANTPQALAEKIVILLQDGRLRATLGNSGRNRLEREFSIEAMVARIGEVYRELVSAT